MGVLHTHSRRLEFHPHVHMAMPATAFDVEHVLPRGFRRSRNFGMLHPNFKHRRLLDLLRLRRRPVLSCASGSAGSAATAMTAGAPLSERPKLLCRCCGAAMVIMRRRTTPETQAASGRGCGRGPGSGATESAPLSARPGDQTQERTLH